MNMVEDMALYLIELEPIKDPHAKWYVGISREPGRRYSSHKSGWGSQWTARNEIKEQYILAWGGPDSIKKYETITTLLLMNEFGIESTRGAGYNETDREYCPEMDTEEIDPELASCLAATGHPDLLRFADRGGIHCTATIDITLKSDEEVNKLLEILPEGTEVDAEVPEYGTQELIAGDPSSILGV